MVVYPSPALKGKLCLFFPLSRSPFLWCSKQRVSKQARYDPSVSSTWPILICYIYSQLQSKILLFTHDLGELKLLIYLKTHHNIYTEEIYSLYKEVTHQRGRTFTGEHTKKTFTKTVTVLFDSTTEMEDCARYYSCILEVEWFLLLRHRLFLYSHMSTVTSLAKICQTVLKED